MNPTAECIEHTQQPGKQVYCNAWRGGRQRARHRLVLIDATGQEPPGMLALHRCNNKRCINPEHLYWGTAHDNAQDAVRAGAQRPRTLSRETVQEIRARCVPGVRGGGVHGPNTQSALAREFNTHQSVIRQILLGTSYKEA